jgi:SAM-dependent methyltransferase
MLDRLMDDWAGKRLLDVCCGTGHLAAAAAARGAEAQGLDFADTMVARARANHPRVAFRQGEAEALPYAEASFDAVACAFGLLHVAEPEAVIAEAFRALKPGGRYAFTVWFSPRDGMELYRLLLPALKEHGDADALPPAPPPFRFASEDECRRVLGEAGFAEVSFERLELKWRGTGPEQVIELIRNSLVRTSMMLEAQTAAARARIHAAVIAAADADYRRGEAIELGFPAALITATKV